MKQISIILSFFLSLTIVCQVMAEESVQPQQIYPKVCEERLYSFPKTFFKLAVFCDDAAGTNIGIIYHEHEGGSDWYWQDPQWSRDVTAFWWNSEKKSLYISTSGIYGSGAVYELDLVNRKSRNVLPKGYPPTAGTYTSEIMRYDNESNSLECKVEYFHRDKKEPVSEVIKIPVK
jgi:hypothetical protein